MMVLSAGFISGCANPGEIPKDAGFLRIYSDVPPEIDPDTPYLIYLHGRIIEDRGVRPTHPRFGVYEYREILEVLAAHGFVVISERRPAGTDGTAYAARVVDQVNLLLAAGVPPEHVTVAGFSKGGGIAIVASSRLPSDRVNVVLMGACSSWLDSRPEIIPSGRLLSLREASDELAGSCEELFGRRDEGEGAAEIVLELGGGHGAFYRPHSEWIEPLVEWARSY
jgi:acetyl esterase/lipase